MRLIDADKLKIGLSEKTKTDSESSRFIDIIDGQTTAYDLNKVVGQLKNSKTNFIGMGTLQSAYFDKGIDKAIEIVKSGGVLNGKEV